MSLTLVQATWARLPLSRVTQVCLPPVFRFIMMRNIQMEVRWPPVKTQLCACGRPLHDLGAVAVQHAANNKSLRASGTSRTRTLLAGFGSGKDRFLMIHLKWVAANPTLAQQGIHKLINVEDVVGPGTLGHPRLPLVRDHSKHSI